MSPPITAGMPLSVQNTIVKGVFEPTVMPRSGVVPSSPSLATCPFKQQQNVPFIIKTHVHSNKMKKLTKVHKKYMSIYHGITLKPLVQIIGTVMIILANQILL
jgi:hypothetical protein